MSSTRLNDKAGEQRYAEKVARCDEAPGDGAVGFTWSGVVEVVVAQQQAIRAEANGVPEHPVRTDADALAVARPHNEFLAN